MKFSSYTTFFNLISTSGLEEACASAKRLGTECVELLDICPSYSTPLYERYTVKGISDALAHNGLTLSCYSLGANLCTPDKENMLENVFRHVKLAAELGSPFFHHTFTLGLDATPKTAPFDKVFKEVLPLAKRIAEYVNALGMTCLYEPQGYYFNGVDNLKRLLTEMKTSGYNVGICADTGNPLFIGSGPNEIFSHFKDDIRHVHVKDYIPCKERTDLVTLSGGYLYDCPLGEGIAEVDKCLDVLASSGYEANISLEVVGDEPLVIRDMEYVKKRLGLYI